MSDPLDLKKYIREVNDFPIQGYNLEILPNISKLEGFQKTCKDD